MRELDKPFLMPVEDVFSITGRGTVATGRIEQGIVKTGETVEIVGIRPTASTVVTGVEMFRKILDQGQAGDNVGCLLRGTKREEIERGQVLCKPGSITPHTHFKSEVYVLKKEEGGRHTPFFSGYRPQFYFRTTDVTGVANLPEGVEMVMPGDNVQMEIELIQPIAMDPGSAVRDPRGRPHGRLRRRDRDHQVRRLRRSVPRPANRQIRLHTDRRSAARRAPHARRAPAGRRGRGSRRRHRSRTTTEGKQRRHLATGSPKQDPHRLKAYDTQAIETAAKEIVDTATRTGATVSGPVPLPTEKNVYCVIRSPFKDKDSREHFEIRTHKRLIDIHHPTPKTVDSLQRLDHLPAGVDIEIRLAS